MITLVKRLRIMGSVASTVVAMTFAPDCAAAAQTSSAPLTMSITVAPAATVSLSTTQVVWSSMTSGGEGLGPDDGLVRISGFMRTSSSGGTGSILVLAPSDLVGRANDADILPISDLSITCTGSGNSGMNAQPHYDAIHSNLRANGTTGCATWGADAMVRVHVDMQMLFNPNAVPADQYTSSGFAIVATAT